MGHLSEQQLATFYRQAAALLVPSLCMEIFSLVIFEAFREQTSAIVRNLGSLPELINECGGRLIYPTDDELVAAMDRLLADPSNRNDLGRRGYQIYKKNGRMKLI